MSIKRKIEHNIRQRKIEVVFANERLITPSGPSIVGGLLKKSEFMRLANRMPVKQKRSEPQIKNGDILLSYIGLLCQGKTEFEAVEEMRGYMLTLLGKMLPTRPKMETRKTFACGGI